MKNLVDSCIRIAGSFNSKMFERKNNLSTFTFTGKRINELIRGCWCGLFEFSRYIYSVVPAEGRYAAQLENEAIENKPKQ